MYKEKAITITDFDDLKGLLYLEAWGIAGNNKNAAREYFVLRITDTNVKE